MAAAVISGVDQQTQTLGAAHSEAQQRLDRLEDRIRSLEALKPDEDPAAYQRGQIDLIELRVAGLEAADDAARAHLEYSAARTQVRREIKQALAPERRRLIEKMHRALKAAAEVREEIDAFDDRAEQLLGGDRLPACGWPAGPDDVEPWLRRTNE